MRENIPLLIAKKVLIFLVSVWLLSLAVFPIAFFFMITVMGGYGKDYAGAVQATNEMSGAMVEYIRGIYADFVGGKRESAGWKL